MLKKISFSFCIALFFFLLLITKGLLSQDNIWRIQKLLQEQGFQIDTVDGLAGPNTIEAIKNWQFLNNHKQTGVLTNQQFNELKSQEYKLSKEEKEIIKNKFMKTTKEFTSTTKAKVQQLSFSEFIFSADFLLWTGLISGYISLFWANRNKRSSLAYQAKIAKNLGILSSVLIVFLFYHFFRYYFF